MLDSTTAEVLKRFADVTSLAGIRGQIDEEAAMFGARFELDQGRSQMVYARAVPKALRTGDVIRIFSPCRRLKKGFMRGLARDQALELLQLNAKLLIARYEVVEQGGELLVMSSVDAMLDTLDTDEVQAYFWGVAIAADAYEKKYGRDEF